MTFDERIYNKAIADGMPAILSTLIVAQARHETGNYTSNVFKTCNNCFGYKWVGQSTSKGPCTGSPEGDSYAAYASIEDSVHELTAWIKRRQRDGKFPANLSSITTPDQYATLLKNSGYYGAPVNEYLAGLIHWLNQISNTVQDNGGVILMIFVAIAILIYRKRTH